jgi:hypothetical protein
MRAGIVQLTAVVLSVASCSSATEPVANVTALVIPGTVNRIVESSSGRVDVSLRFSVSNPTTASIYFGRCGPSLERQVDNDSWRIVASTICPAIAPANPLELTLEIPAGESREVSAFMSGLYENGLPLTVPQGTYRVVFSVLYRNPVVWRGDMGNQYKSLLAATSEFELPPN